MKARDWRALPPSVVAPLYTAEAARWATALHWDTAPVWQRVETARRAGMLPGVVIETAGGTIAGWSFFLRHHESLQIGGFVAEHADATRALLDAVVAAPEAETAGELLLFAYAGAPALEDALAGRGFTVGAYRYLTRALSVEVEAPDAGRAYVDRDARPVARLLSRAYAAPDAVRPFARSGRYAEWTEYVDQLVVDGGCGVFQPALSRIADAPEPARADGAVLTTAIGPGTGHLAQVAVDPRLQRCGLGRRLVAATLAALRAAGYARATLLVAAHNAPAMSLYDRLGFQPVGTFLSAVRAQPRRLSSAALDTGGASTRR
jgi:ribosomal protein S18 acetylase RimI-like enzyme